MTNEELALLVKSGDNSALLELWEQNTGLAHIFARRKYDSLTAAGNMCGVDLDDLLQATFLALVSAVDYYDPGKEFPFTSYWGYRVKAEFSTLLGTRSSRRDVLNSCTSLDAPVSEDEDSGTLNDFVPDPTDDYEIIEKRIFQDQLHSAMEVVLSSLAPDQEKTVRLRYYDGLTIANTAAKMGLDYSTCRTLEMNAFKELRKPKRKRALEPYIDLQTDFYRTGSVARQTSPVESNVIWRETLRGRVNISEETA